MLFFPALWFDKALKSANGVIKLNMIEVTPAALRKIKDYLSQNGIDSGIRVTLLEGGCSGPVLGIVLDDVCDQDRAFDSGGIQFFIHQSLLSECGNVRIDFAKPDSRCDSTCSCGSDGRFEITSERPVAPISGCSCGSGA